MRLIQIGLLLLGLGILPAFSWGGAGQDSEWLVRFARPLTQKEMRLGGLRPFQPQTRDSYFSRLYYAKDPSQANAITETRVLHAERIQTLQSNSIDSRNAIAIGNDPLSIYQWGLLNQGQSLSLDLTDIRSLKIQGKRGEDIGFDAADLVEFENRMSGDAVVAVLDTGVSLDHPELKDAILKNETECQPGSFLPVSEEKDLDGNGWKGDCAGWSFVTTHEAGDQRPYDDVGHGTHIAGILAAKVGNSRGIRGLSSRVRILPVKVLARDEGSRDPRVRPARGLSDRVAQGILYAISRRVDVINLSLGWPKAADTEHLRKAVELAQAQGIMVVAAAGNNSHDGLVFPCSYRGVICVGAVTASGERADFSNSGGAVDLLAPGEQILSTIPHKISPAHLKIPGYDIKDGTSQAAPFVSGALAILRRLFPSEPVSVLLARLQATAKASEHSLFGLVQIGDAIRMKPQPHVLPVFKEVHDVEFDFKTGAFEILLPVTNAWSDAQKIQVNVALANGCAVLDRDSWHWSSFHGLQSEVIRVRGRLNDPFCNSKDFLQVSVAARGLPKKVYQKRLQWVRRLDLNRDGVQREIVWKTDEIKMGAVTPQGVRPWVYSIAEPGSPPSGMFHYVLVPSGETLAMRLLITREEKMVESGEISRPRVEKLLQVLRLQVDGKGEKDLVTVALEKPEASSEGTDRLRIVYCFYHEDGRPLYSEESCFSFQPKTAVPNPVQQSWVPAFFEGRKYLFPLFIETGILPEEDQTGDEWERQPNSPDLHLYSLEPYRFGKEVALRERAIDSEALRASWGRDRGWGVASHVRPVALFPQSAPDLELGRAWGIMSVGRGSLKMSYVFRVECDRRIQLDSSPLSDSRMIGLQVEPTLNIHRGRVELGSGFAFSGVYDETRGLRFWLDKQSDGVRISGYSPMEYDAGFDSLLNPTVSFWDRDRVVRTGVYQSKTHTVVSVEGNGGVRVFREPLERYSYVSGRVFSELSQPMALLFHGQVRPALYLDQSLIQANRIAISIVDESRGLVRPAAFSIGLPANCRSLNPSQDHGQAGYRLTLVCLSEVGRGQIYDVSLASGEAR